MLTASSLLRAPLCPAPLSRRQRDSLQVQVAAPARSHIARRCRVQAIASPPKPNGNGKSAVDDKTSKRMDSLFAENDANQVRFGFPKGSLQESTENLFKRAGYTVKFSSSRNYFPSVDDDELKMVLFRSQEIPRYVEDGILDFGICGRDWVVETGSDVVEVCELRYSKATSNPASWVIAVPQNSPVQTVADLEGKIVASELVNTTKKFFADRNLNVHVEFSWGATEVKARLPGVEAIVDITETGSSLKANNLRIVDTILASTTRLVANKAAWADPVKRRKIEDIAMLLQGAIDGRSKKGLKMNIRKDLVDEVVAMLPAEQSPTVSPLMDPEYVALEVVVEEKLARDIVANCKRLGAQGIFTYPVDVLIE